MKTSMPYPETQRAKPDPLLPAEGYRLWSRTYDSNPNPVLALETRILFAMLDSTENKAVLDVACGTARWAVSAAVKGARAFGTDLVPEMLAVANQKPQVAGRLVQADAHWLPFTDECADIVICSFALGYMRNPELVMRELSRVTKRGGRIVTSDLHPQALDAGWRRTFRFGSTQFEIQTYSCSQERVVHAGRCANLQLKEVLQPHFSEPEFAIMRCAGKADLIDGVSSVPAILVLLWERN